MAIKNILVSYNGLPGSDAALGVAELMARKYDAHLTGILAHGPSRLSAAIGPFVTPRLLDEVMEAERERRGEIMRGFLEATRPLEKTRPGKIHFLDYGGDADESLMEAARVYDLVIMGRCAAEMETAHIAPHPDLVALRSGRPVLVVPPDYRTDRLVERALLAWDGGRAAARAMADAMPILETKSHVVVAAIGDGPRGMRHEGRDVVAHLARHGVHVEWMHVPAPREGVAEALLEAMKAKGAGLLVMGAYEHSRLAEELVGGVTRTMLERAETPVLMSH